MVIKRIAFMAALLSLLYSGAFAAEKDGMIPKENMFPTER